MLYGLIPRRLFFTKNREKETPHLTVFGREAERVLSAEPMSTDQWFGSSLISPALDINELSVNPLECCDSVKGA